MWTNDGPALYLSADKTKVVFADDPEAAFLLVASGAQLPLEEAEKYGLTGETDAVQLTPDEKAKLAQPNKAKAKPDNKSK